MKSKHVIVAGLVCSAWLLAPGAVLADFYDDFDDRSYCQDPNDPNIFDPNLWDIDNPHWTIYELTGSQYVEDANSGELYLYVDSLFVYGFLGAGVDDTGRDPNTSETWWDDSASHYFMARVKYDPNFDPTYDGDPNHEKGRAGLLMHADPATWTGYGFQFDFDKPPGSNGWIGIYEVSGADWPRFQGMGIPPLDEPNGFWMAFQFESDGNPGDPNGKRLRADAWDGDKFDWNGTWRLDVDLGDPNTFHEQPGGYWTIGPFGIATWSDMEWGNGFPALASFDNVEARTGIFTNVSRTLTVKLKDCSSLNLEPNVSHPDGGDKRRYTQGTPIVLDAVVPVGNKVFKKWTIKGPNQSDDPNYLIVSDTNEVVYLTMDGDYLVKATCKCGGGGIEPFAGMVLLVLALGVVVRRMS